jgi:hypothetical protein
VNISQEGPSTDMSESWSQAVSHPLADDELAIFSTTMDSAAQRDFTFEFCRRSRPVLGGSSRMLVFLFPVPFSLACVGNDLAVELGEDR